MSQAWGLVIAGGQGSRLGGVEKARLRLGNKRLLDWVAPALASCNRPLLIGTGRAPAGSELPADAVGIEDLEDGPAGPLAAVLAAVRWLEGSGTTTGLLLTASVDAPLLPADYAHRMLDTLGNRQAVQAVWRESFYPTHALYKIEALRSAINGQRPRSLRHLLANLKAKNLDWSPTYNEDPFLGLNTLGDLIGLGRRAPVVSYSQRRE